MTNDGCQLERKSCRGLPADRRVGGQRYSGSLINNGVLLPIHGSWATSMVTPVVPHPSVDVHPLSTVKNDWWHSVARRHKLVFVFLNSKSLKSFQAWLVMQSESHKYTYSSTNLDSKWEELKRYAKCRGNPNKNASIISWGKNLWVYFEYRVDDEIRPIYLSLTRLARDQSEHHTVAWVGLRLEPSVFWFQNEIQPPPTVPEDEKQEEKKYAD